jgi:hypothetical protein
MLFPWCFPAEEVVGLHFGEAPSGQTRLFSLGADRRLLEYNLTATDTANAGLRALAVLDVVAPGGAGTPCSMCFAPPMPYYSHASMDTLLLVAGEQPGHDRCFKLLSQYRVLLPAAAPQLQLCCEPLQRPVCVWCNSCLLGEVLVVTYCLHGVFVDDVYKIKAYNPDAKAASATYLGPTFGGPITKLLPFRYAGNCCEHQLHTLSLICSSWQECTACSTE